MACFRSDLDEFCSLIENWGLNPRIRNELDLNVHSRIDSDFSDLIFLMTFILGMLGLNVKSAERSRSFRQNMRKERTSRNTLVVQRT